MTRITKKPDERRAELIDTAEEFFETVGYNNTAVSDIVKKINVAQGTFYYYFKSKEDILLAIFDKYTQQNIIDLKQILNSSDLNMIEKYAKVLDTQFKIIKNNKKISAQIHNKENAGIHQKAIINAINSYTPIYEELLKQGIKEGKIKTDYPYEISEFLLLIMNFLFDPGMFHFTIEEYKKKIEALNDMIMKVLEVPEKYKDVIQIKEKAIELYQEVTS